MLKPTSVFFLYQAYWMEFLTTDALLDFKPSLHQVLFQNFLVPSFPRLVAILFHICFPFRLNWWTDLAACFHHI